jgi:lipopolysaccharide transport system permease protein
MAFVRREVGVRYKEAYVGVAWAVLQPLAYMLIFTLLFSRLSRIPGTGPLTAYVALVPWTFVSASIGQASQSVLGQLSVVSKIYFPRGVLPLSAVVAAGVDALIAFALQLVLMVATGTALRPALLLWPLLMVLAAAVCLGVGLILAPAVVRFRDLRYAIPIGLQLLLLGSPVGYPLSAVPEEFRHWYLLNPFAGLMESFRAISLRGEVPAVGMLLPALAWAAVLLVVGGLYFRVQEATVADYV